MRERGRESAIKFSFCRVESRPLSSVRSRTAKIATYADPFDSSSFSILHCFSCVRRIMQ